MKKLSSEKCFICGKSIENENIKKDNHYFCTNDCESEYWNKYISVKSKGCQNES